MPTRTCMTSSLQVTRASQQDPVAAAVAVNSAERWSRLQDQRHVHQRHQTVPLCCAQQERGLVSTTGVLRNQTALVYST